MGHIGQPLNAGNLAVQTGTGDGADTTPIATLDYSVGSSESVAIYLDGVKQAVATYTASGTTLTFTTAPPNGVGIEVVFLALPISLPTPGDGTVDETKLKDALIADFTEVVVTASDSILLGDATDSGNTKRDTVQGIIDLVPSPTFTWLATQATTSGTAATFTGIPSTATEIMAVLEGVGSATGAIFLMRLGDSGGIETTGYVGGSFRYHDTLESNATTGLNIVPSTTNSLLTAVCRFTLTEGTNEWVMTGNNFDNNATLSGSMSVCSKTLTAVLTQVEFTGGVTLNAGQMKVGYK